MDRWVGTSEFAESCLQVAEIFFKYIYIFEVPGTGINPAHREEPASCSQAPMREPKEHMWEVASLKACHSLHKLSVTEVPNQPWLEAHKAPHCESRTSL